MFMCLYFQTAVGFDDHGVLTYPHCIIYKLSQSDFPDGIICRSTVTVRVCKCGFKVKEK